MFLVGGAGVGKSKSVNAAEKLLRQVLPKESFGSTSMTMASMCDLLVDSKRIIPVMPPPAIEYTSLMIVADELTAFMNDWKNQADLIAGLTKFYDCTPYSQARRGNIIRISLDQPQVNILTGTTPSNLVRFIPDWAWDQGFTSRIFLIYSGESPDTDVFTAKEVEGKEDLTHDLKVIDSLIGDFGWTDDYADAVNKWQDAGFDPAPTHPKLIWYNSRRRAHLLKLSMIASVSRSNELKLRLEDYVVALKWMIQAEHFMPDVFRATSITADSKAMEEIYHFIASNPKGEPEHRIKNFAIGKIPAQWILQTLTVMEGAGLIKAVSVDKLGSKLFKAQPKPQSHSPSPPQAQIQ